MDSWIISQVSFWYTVNKVSHWSTGKKCYVRNLKIYFLSLIGETGRDRRQGNWALPWHCYPRERCRREHMAHERVENHWTKFWSGRSRNWIEKRLETLGQSVSWDPPRIDRSMAKWCCRLRGSDFNLQRTETSPTKTVMWQRARQMLFGEQANSKFAFVVDCIIDLHIELFRRMLRVFMEGNWLHVAVG